MRAPRFIQIGIAFGQIPVDYDMLDKAIESEALDWIHLSRGLYIVWTTSDAETIYRKIMAVHGMAYSWFTIFGLNIDDGFLFLPQAAWEWIKKDRGSGHVTTWTTPWKPPALNP